MDDELTKKIEQILGYVKNLDFNNKLILNKLNLLMKDRQEHEISPKIENTKLAKVEAVETSPSPLVVSKPLLDNLILTQQKNMTMEKKISVQQRICYADGKPAVLVNVEIFDLQDIVIKKTKTNQVGKWTTLLDPGKYKIKLTKSGTTEKPSISKMLEIELFTDKTPIELDTVQG